MRFQLNLDRPIEIVNVEQPIELLGESLLNGCVESPVLIWSQVIAPFGKHKIEATNTALQMWAGIENA